MCIFDTDWNKINYSMLDFAFGFWKTKLKREGTFPSSGFRRFSNLEYRAPPVENWGENGYVQWYSHFSGEKWLYSQFSGGELL